MKIGDARALAAKWLAENFGKLAGFLGSYLSGSTAWGDPQAEFRAGSDVDLFVVLDVNELPNAPGKIFWHGVVLEINFITYQSIANPEQILGDYHIAGAFIANGLLSDPEGKIAKIRQTVAAEFSAPSRILQRCLHAKTRAGSFITQFRQSTQLHDKVTNLYFGAGVCAHMILVADQANPTIRRRYAQMQKSLQHHGELAFHEHLLTSLGSNNWTQKTAIDLLAQVATSFDLACAVIRSPYQFASDMTKATRPIAIDGAAEMIDAGYHREAAFWLVAISARSRAVVAKDGSAAQLDSVDAALSELLAYLGTPDIAAMNERATRIEADIENCWALCEKIASGNN